MQNKSSAESSCRSFLCYFRSAFKQTLKNCLKGQNKSLSFYGRLSQVYITGTFGSVSLQAVYRYNRYRYKRSLLYFFEKYCQKLTFSNGCRRHFHGGHFKYPGCNGLKYGHWIRLTERAKMS